MDWSAPALAIGARLPDVGDVGAVGAVGDVGTGVLPVEVPPLLL